MLHLLAACFAAKEAVVKALGTGFSEGISPLEIEIGNKLSGAPSIALSGAAFSNASSQGIENWLISISHTDNIAMASVIAIGSTDR